MIMEVMDKIKIRFLCIYKHLRECSKLYEDNSIESYENELMDLCILLSIHKTKHEEVYQRRIDKFHQKIKGGVK